MESEQFGIVVARIVDQSSATNLSIDLSAGGVAYALDNYANASVTISAP